MEQEPQLLEPCEQIAVFNEKVREMMPAYCCLTAREADGRSSARGTGVFVRRGGQHYMATAQHVLDVLRTGAWLSLSPVDNQGRPLVGAAASSTALSFTPSIVFESRELDVALCASGRCA